MESTICTLEATGDMYWLCENVHLTSGECCTFFLGPCGVYVIADRVCSAPGRLYVSLREKLDVHHLQIYIENTGLYDPAEDSLLQPFPSQMELVESVEQWLFYRHPLYKEHLLAQMVNKLQLEDAKAIGHMTLDDGSLVVFRHGVPHPGSPYDPERIFKLAVFGGCFGLHRFAMGKWFSGILYFFTCGLFLAGWFVDVLSLFFSIQKDGHKRYVLPLQDKKSKLVLFAGGLLVSIGIYFVYSQVTQLMFSGLLFGATQQMSPSDVSRLTSFSDWLQSLQTPH